MARYAKAVHSRVDYRTTMRTSPDPVSDKRQIVIFARAPRYGLVKTRLAADIGERQALHFYQDNLRSLIQLLQHGPWQLHAAVDCTSDANHPIFNGLITMAQSSGDLGNRMKTVLNQYSDRSCLIIGGDIPFINAKHIHNAFELLNTHQYVFGPAADGGYWLAGSAAGVQHQTELMQGVRWSTPDALADTLATVPKGCRFALADSLFDVDNGESYQDYLRTIAQQNR